MLKLSKEHQEYLENLTIQENREIIVGEDADAFINETAFNQDVAFERTMLTEACNRAIAAHDLEIKKVEDRLEILHMMQSDKASELYMQDEINQKALSESIQNFTTLLESLLSIKSKMEQIKEPLEGNQTKSLTKSIDLLNRLVWQAEAESKVAEHRNSEGIGNVEDSIYRAMQDIAEQKAANGEEAVQDIVPLPAEWQIEQPHDTEFFSRSKAIADNGGNILEFQLAGSGFSELRKEKKGFHGDGTVQMANKKLKVMDEPEKMLKVSFYNRFLSWLPGIKSTAKIKEENRARLLRQVAKKRMDETYGESETSYNIRDIQAHSLKSDEQKKKEVAETKKTSRRHVREREILGAEGGSRTKVSIGGPGMRNAGEYSIENTSKYMQDTTKSYILDKLSRYDLGNPAIARDAPPITINVRGHSRGAVSAYEGVKKIKDSLQERYGNSEAGRILISKVKFNVVQYDPVPGLGSYDDHKLADYEDRVGNDRGGINSTVVYALHSEHSIGFTPQEVIGANRLILSPGRHGVGTNEIDTSQLDHMHSQTITDTRNNQYRGMGIGELPDGVYILDEQNVLHELNTVDLALKTIDNVLESAESGQAKRTKVIKAAIIDWFNRHAA